MAFGRMITRAFTCDVIDRETGKHGTAEGEVSFSGRGADYEAAAVVKADMEKQGLLAHNVKVRKK